MALCPSPLAGEGGAKRRVGATRRREPHPASHKSAKPPPCRGGMERVATPREAIGDCSAFQGRVDRVASLCPMTCEGPGHERARRPDRCGLRPCARRFGAARRLCAARCRLVRRPGHAQRRRDASTSPARPRPRHGAGCGARRAGRTGARSCSRRGYLRHRLRGPARAPGAHRAALEADRQPARDHHAGEGPGGTRGARPRLRRAASGDRVGRTLRSDAMAGEAPRRLRRRPHQDGDLVAWPDPLFPAPRPRRCDIGPHLRGRSRGRRARLQRAMVRADRTAAVPLRRRGDAGPSGAAYHGRTRRDDPAPRLALRRCEG